MKSHQEIHGITPTTLIIYVPHTKITTFISNSQLACYHTTNQQFHAITHTKRTNSSTYRSSNHAYSRHIAKPWIN